METGPAAMRTHSHMTSTNADSFRRVEVITGVGRRRRWTVEEKWSAPIGWSALKVSA
jgi:hypothetical protein